MAELSRRQSPKTGWGALRPNNLDTVGLRLLARVHLRILFSSSYFSRPSLTHSGLAHLVRVRKLNTFHNTFHSLSLLCACTSDRGHSIAALRLGLFEVHQLVLYRQLQPCYRSMTVCNNFFRDSLANRKAILLMPYQ